MSKRSSFKKGKRINYFSAHCGLGDSSGPGEHATDNACKEHDDAYKKLSEEGKDPYWKYNPADEAFKKTLGRTQPESIREAVVHAGSTVFVHGKGALLPSMSSLSNKRLRGNISPRNDKVKKLKPSMALALRDDDAMDTETDGPVAIASTSRASGVALANTGSTNKGVQETQVMYRSPTFGLPETHTTILPINHYLTVVNNQYNSVIQFNMKMSSLITICDTLTAPATGAITANRYNKKLSNAEIVAKAWAATPGVNYPETNTTSPVPDWASYWGNFYQYYHILGVHWKITFIRPFQDADGEDNSMTVVWGLESYDSTATAGNIIPITGSLRESYAWPQVYHHNLPSTTLQDGPHVSSISGTYKFGDARRNVRNDEDTKTWTAVGSAPALVQNLKLLFYGGPSNTSDMANSNVQVHCQLKYIVQYKDLETSARYPENGGAAIVATLPNDAL